MMSDLPSALRVAPDAHMLEVMSEFLRRNRVAATAANDAQLDAALASNSAHVIVLDLSLLANGATALDRLSKRLLRPRSLNELLSLVQELANQNDFQVSSPTKLSEALDLGNGWFFHSVGRWIRAPDRATIMLSSAELELVQAFLRYPRQVVTRETLAKHLTGVPRLRAVDVLVSRLRRKLEPHAQGHLLVRMMRAEGYLFTGASPGLSDVPEPETASVLG